MSRVLVSTTLAAVRGYKVRSLSIAVLAAVALADCGGQSASGASTATPAPDSGGSSTGIGTAAAAARLASPAPQRSRRRTATLSLITEPNQGIGPVRAAIQHARHWLELVMYEDEDQQLDAALAADERRGVHVRVLLNGGYYGGGSPQNRVAYGYLKAHGVPVRWTPSYFALTHEKTLVIDGTAYILTFNFTPAYYASSRDFGVVDANPEDVSAIMRTFDADWAGRRIAVPDGKDLVWSPGSEQAQVKLLRSARGWVDVYNEEMDETGIEDALEADARRGVDVEVTMTADSSWNQAFSELADAGVHVHTYAAEAPLYIHAKMILTSTRAFLGSENFSYASLFDNRELGIVLATRRIIISLRRTFDADYAGARPFTASVSGASSSPAQRISNHSRSSESAECSATASYSERYGDYDVYVQSNQPTLTVTVSDAAGRSDSWHTDSSGYADVYFHAPAAAAGETLTVHVGAASCQTKL